MILDKFLYGDFDIFNVFNKEPRCKFNFITAWNIFPFKASPNQDKVEPSSSCPPRENRSLMMSFNIKQPPFLLVFSPFPLE
jgi:hypothetical protein